MATSDDQTINLPQLFLIIVLGGLALRYFFFSPAASTLPSAAGRTSRAREADVERIQQMFPQLDRRSILWDLQRNGGNVVATTERVLTGRGLEVPPQSFQPLPAPVSSSTNRPSTTTTTTSSSGASKAKPPQPDLITRYNLQDRISSPASGSSTPEPSLAPSPPPAPDSASASPSPRPRKSWSANKNERQALLQRRRDEMILAARRKMEERVAREAEVAGAGAGAESVAS